MVPQILFAIKIIRQITNIVPIRPYPSIVASSLRLAAINGIWWQGQLPGDQTAKARPD